MPELPEVETIRLQLNQALKGLKITNIEVLSPKNFIGSVDEVVDRKVVGVERRAKIILLKLSGGKCLAVHLKLTGQLIYRETRNGKRETGNAIRNTRNEREKNGPFAVKKLPNKYTRVTVNFSNGGRLYFNDLRKFGWMRVVTNQELRIMNQELGIEPFDKEFTVEYLQKVFSRTSRAIKLVLLDQKKIAGIGNIYANEALFWAKIRPNKPAKQLSYQAIKQLRKAIIKVLKDSILHKGTSDQDEAYRQISGEKGKHQDYLKVYSREGEKCPKCGGRIKRVKIGGRGTFFCPACQQ